MIFILATLVNALAQNQRFGMEINWNYYRVLKDESPEVESVSEAFHTFLQKEIVDGDRCIKIALKNNEGLIFDDRRVLHGRMAFEAEKIRDRCIWKCEIA